MGPPLARFAGSDGDGPRTECYARPTAPSRSGREAWLVGGADAQVVYRRPR